MPRTTARRDDGSSDEAHAQQTPPNASADVGADAALTGETSPAAEARVHAESQAQGQAQTGPTPSPTKGGASRGRRKAASEKPFVFLDDDQPYDSGIESGKKADLDIAADDLDAAERFDLGDSIHPRGRNADNSIVDVIDEAYDSLGLDDQELDGEVTIQQPARASAKRNGRVTPSNGATDEIEVTVEVEEVLEVEVVEEADESEPDPDELARTATEVEPVEEQPEELERFIDRVLSMESVSVDDPVRIYLREIGRTALLKSPDESALAEKMTLGRAAVQEIEAAKQHLEAGELGEAEFEEIRRRAQLVCDEGARAKQMLVQANLRLVVSIARRYIGRGLSLLDLIQEGNIGLMKAADKFDHRKGFKFSTYATWWIRQAITRAISDQSRTIRLPVHVTEMVTRLRRAAHDLQQKLLREPTEEELGQALNMPAERVRKILDMARHPASLDAPMEEGEDSFLGDFIEDERTGGPEEEASRQMLKEQVDDILRKLSDRERQILQMRYGLTDDRPRTLEEVAKEFGITRERIRQIETRILRKLRYARYGASKLRGYLD
jgi:RNA polymerase primary sigma factor